MLMVLVGAGTALLGLVGCFVPVLPGPLIAYVGLWALVAFGYPPSTAQLVIASVVLAVVTLIDYVLPSLCAKKFKCSGWGVFGCFVGSIVGLFFMPLGIILGPFLGTVAGELIAGKELSSSVRGGFGALLGFVLCLGLKIASVGLFAWWYFTRIPHASPEHGLFAAPITCDPVAHVYRPLAAPPPRTRLQDRPRDQVSARTNYCQLGATRHLNLNSSVGLPADAAFAA